MIRTDLARRREAECWARTPLVAFRDPALQASALLRVALGLHQAGWTAASESVAAAIFLVYKLQLDPSVHIGEGLLLRRAMGVAVVGGSTLGSRVTLSEGARIGEAHGDRVAPAVIEDGVVFEAGSHVCGGVRVGEGAVIGPDRVVSIDVLAFSETAGDAVVPLPAGGPRPARAAGEREDREPRPRAGVRETVSLIRSDFRRRADINGRRVLRVCLTLPLTSAALAALSYRISHHLWRRGMRGPALWMRAVTCLVWGADIHPAARIGPGLYLAHTTSVVVGEGAIIGSDAVLCAHTSVDRHAWDAREHALYPVVGNDAFIADGARLLGAARAGDSVVIGSNSVLADGSVESLHVVVGLSGRHVRPVGERSPAVSMNAVRQTLTWRDTVALIRSDRQARSDALERGEPRTQPRAMESFAAAALGIMRTMHYLHANGLPALARVLFMVNQSLFGIEVTPGTLIGERFRVREVYGSVLAQEAELRSDVTIGSGTTIGGTPFRSGQPIVGRGVRLGAGTGVYGPVEIGEGTDVAAGSVVTRDLPAGVLAGGAPARPLAAVIRETGTLPASPPPVRSTTPPRLRKPCLEQATERGSTST